MFAEIVKPIIEILDLILPAALALVTSLGIIWSVVLGVKLAKAEEPQDREKAKTALRNAIVGFVLIFVLIAVLLVAEPLLSEWLDTYIENYRNG